MEFPLLADSGNETARDYGLVYRCPEDVKSVFLEVLQTDLSEYNGDDSWTLPMPARYLIDGERTVRWASVSPDYTQRPDPVDTLEALEEMQGG